MKESTKDIFKLHGWRIDRAVHNYLYFAFYDLYVKYFLKAGRFVRDKLGGLKLSAAAFGVVFDRYHSKIITYDNARKMLSVKEDLDLGADYKKRIVPFKYANKIILKETDYIAVMDCPCRKSRENGCEPANVCIAVGKTTARFWMEHCDKYNVRKIDADEALQIIRDARDRGEITTAWFKVATGARTGVICNCCKCCCGGLEGMRIAQSLNYGKELFNTIPSGYKVDYDPQKCDNCGICADVCFFDAIEMTPDGDVLYHADNCMGCGLCVEKCDQGARSLNENFKDIYPLDLDIAKKELA